ncbi:MAG: hypothetical protein K2G42_00980, partial [Clostridia bacterium]|nr:hypothetical protein [Clostridia bacterium]
MNFSKQIRVQKVCLVTIIALAMLISCIGVISLKCKSTEALTITNGEVSSAQAKNLGELLLDGYEGDTTGTGKVFNGAVFFDMIEAITGQKNMKLSDIATLALTKTSNDIRNNGNSINNGKDLVVEINGLKWMPTYLSTNSSGEPILTFWLANSSENKVRSANFNTSVTNSKGKYPSPMYGTSWMRASVLNNGGGYAAAYNASSLTSVAQSASSDWAIYTMTKAQGVAGSIKEFIEVPNNVSWQRNQQALTHVTSSEYRTSYGYNNNNDALDLGGNGTAANFLTDATVDTTGYKAWGADSIWLPSIAETGVNGVEGMWKLSNNQRSNSQTVWLRSARYFNYDCVYVLAAGGTGMGVGNVGPTYSNGVRPAFHLNLKKVVDRVGFSEPSDVESQYNGEIQDLSYISDTTKTNWYNTNYMLALSCPTDMKSAKTHAVTVKLDDDAIATGAVFAGEPDTSKGEDDYTRVFEFKITPKPLSVTWSNNDEGVAIPSLIDTEICSNVGGVKDTVNINVKYTGRNDTVYDSTTMPKKIGDYTVTITSLSNSNYSLADNVALSKNFIKTETNIPLPTFFPKSWYIYNGSTRTYELELGGDYKGDYTVHIPTEFIGKYELNKNVTTDGTVTVKVAQAGTYELELRLTDDINTQWRFADGTVAKDSVRLEFKIEPLPLELKIESDTIIDSMLEEDLDLYVQVQSRPRTGESVLLDFYVQRVGSESETLVYSDFVLDSQMADFTIKLQLSKVEIPANYKLIVKVKNIDGSSDYTNYKATWTDITFNIQEKVDVNSSIFWQLRINGVIKTSMYFDIDIATTPVFDKIELVYSGKEHSLTTSLPSGYSVDTSYSVEGYINGYKNAKGTNAGEYITTARVKTPEGTIKEYSIKWTIEKAKFDLSNVKWQYDGQLPYNKVDGSQAILDPKTLPEGLIPTYGNYTGTTVGTSGSAYVTFALASGYEDNYVLPDENDPTSYIDSNEDFEWNKSWNIVKAEIQASSWKNSSTTDSNGKAFDIPVLRDPNADGDVVTYEYYECDSMGNIKSDTPIRKEDIIWSESQAKFYIAKPVLQDTLNYLLDDPSAQSKIFRVGKDLTKVSVSLESATMEYNTNPRHAKLAVANGALPTTAFDLTYYDGYTRLATAPTEVGNYRVEISLKNAFIDRYQIDGDYEFDYAIVKAQIAVEWNDNIKPPTLKLKYGQINGVEYEIVDADDNVVAYNELVAGRTYRIRGKIKDDQLNNFIFADGTTQTEWKEFSVTGNEELYDPNSPSNPSYPQTDPDLPSNSGDNNTPSGDTPGSGNNSGGTLDEILQKLKEIPLWQLIASIISIILILIFASKGFGYLSKSKQNKRMAESKYKTYYAGAFLGLATAGWTAIACVLMGLAVLSIVFMIIAKSKYNKSLIYAEELRDEYERNKADVEDRKREEEARKRDENMQMMFMSMMGGNAGGNMGQGMPQGGYAYAQPGISVEEMRGLISETVTAMLPGMQQMLPQQASNNDEIIKQIMKTQEDLAHNQELLMKKMTDQPTERIVEKEVVATLANDETIKQMMKTQENLMQNQE